MNSEETIQSKKVIGVIFLVVTLFFAPIGKAVVDPITGVITWLVMVALASSSESALNEAKIRHKRAKSELMQLKKRLENDERLSDSLRGKLKKHKFDNDVLEEQLKTITKNIRNKSLDQEDLLSEIKRLQKRLTSTKS